MTEYIERGVVLSVIEYIRTKYINNYNRRSKWNQFWSDTIRYFEKKVKGIPAADVAEVRHGEWVSARPSGGYDFYCSCCKEFAITYEDNNYREQYHLTDYCPNCGAKMDGKGG